MALLTGFVGGVESVVGEGEVDGANGVEELATITIVVESTGDELDVSGVEVGLGTMVDVVIMGG